MSPNLCITPSPFSCRPHRIFLRRAHAKDKKNIRQWRCDIEPSISRSWALRVRIYIAVCYLVLQIWTSKDILKSHDAPASQMRNKFDGMQRPITFDFKTHCHARIQLVVVHISYVYANLRW
jgi:hypothetical protein